MVNTESPFAFRILICLFIAKIESLLNKLNDNPTDYVSMRDLLFYIRRNKIRKSDLIIQYAPILLKKSSHLLSEVEKWETHEQIFLAALDTNNQHIAQEFLSKLRKKFGVGSVRVQGLMALIEEAFGNFLEAEKIYKVILENDPTNIFAMKREISIRKANGDSVLTIRLLNEYLKIFMADLEAWQELADVYIDQQQYKNAAFCYEELILSAPQNYHFSTKYAEILFTIGGYDNLKLSRKYFSNSLELNSTNLRALYGLFICSISIASTKQGKTEKENQQIFEWSSQKLIECYKDFPQKLLLVQSFLNKSKE